MRNAGLEEAQPGIKTAGRNINNFRYAYDSTLMAESEEELKSFLMKVEKESKNIDLKSTFRKLRSWHPVPSLYGKMWGNNGNSDRLFCGAPKPLQMVSATMKLQDACSLEETL